MNTTETQAAEGTWHRRAEELLADTLRLEKKVERLEGELSKHRADLRAAAGELLVELPKPGTVVAKLLRANVLMRGERDEARASLSTAESALIVLKREHDRLQRACDEGLPREVIRCPKCNGQHIDGASGVEFATRPHHTHRCEHCGEVWDNQRWSFGADVREPVVPFIELERQALQRALDAAKGRVQTAARLLQIGRTTMYRKIAELGLVKGDQ